ncbi:MAG TPA: CPBP family intramembrane glutamic endopeptidase [Galbitalea sp.]|nr:CPBP family intramembrane glutamic endopeptidase [Galbitalea sp.]
MTSTSAWARFWDLGRWWKAVIAVVVYLVLYQLGALLVGTLFGNRIDSKNLFANASSVFFGLGAPLIIGAILLILFLLSVGWIKPTFAGQPVNRPRWMWIFVVLAAIPIVLRLIGINYGSYASGVVITTFVIGLFIGFTEELLYRGIVVRILRNGGHSERVVAVVSSLLFGLSHLTNLASGQPIGTVALTVLFTFGFGMMMYLVMRATGNIVWAMVIHALTDPTTFLASGGVDVASTSTSPLLSFAGPFNIVFVVAALIAIIFIRGRVETGRAAAAA